MAAPIIVESGPYYEVLKIVAKSKHKYIGLLLSKDESADVYSAALKDFFQVGVLARILKIIPLEQKGKIFTC